MLIKGNFHQYSKEKGLQEISAHMALEEKWEIYLNNQLIVSLFCSPVHIDELAVGFLTAEGIICPDNSIMEIEKKEKKVFIYADGVREVDFQKKTLTTGCGMGITLGNITGIEEIKSTKVFNIKEIGQIIKKFQGASLENNQTGGLHSAGLLDKGELILRKDVGRHNAVDKIIGYSLLNSLSLDNQILFLTGRISTEIIFKAARVNLPIIISFSSATSLATETAQKLGITLIGYARKRKFYIYSHPERIKD